MWPISGSRSRETKCMCWEAEDSGRLHIKSSEIIPITSGDATYDDAARQIKKYIIPAPPPWPPN